MKKSTLLATLFSLGLLFTTNLNAQTSCCSKEKKNEKACTTTAKSCSTSVKETKESTSGCSPSGCRGAKTKMGEAKVISTLRLSLIDLKAEMEKSIQPKFDARSYDIHNIIGETDDESLALILNEVNIVEDAFNKELSYKSTTLELPTSKAKQVKYLSDRIQKLKNVLKKS